MIEQEEVEFVEAQVKRLAAKPKWPFEVEAQLELARIASKYGTDLIHVNRVIQDISETWDHCPDGVELKKALIDAIPVPVPRTRTTTCELGLCDGHGWMRVFALWTTENRNGSTFVKKERITEEQYNLLSKRVDHQSQEVYDGVKHCDCERGQRMKATKESVEVTKR